jgi:maleate isomerase
MSEEVHRIGLLVPSRDGVTEMDFKNLLPRDVSFHTGRMYVSDAIPRGVPALDAIVDQIEQAIKIIEQVDPELIVFACTSGSFYRGIGWDDRIASRITGASGVPAVVTTTAVVDALHSLEARRIFMVTPYREEINQLEVEFLSDSGIEVSGCANFHFERSRDIPHCMPSEIIARVRAHREAILPQDALLISCTAFRGTDTISRLEAELNIPVVTSNAATVWAVLHRLGLATTGIPGGRLFELPPGKLTAVAGT